MSKRFAAIDLGTNTFHILIVEKHNQAPFFSPIFRQREYVFLGRNGVEHISDESFEKGIETLKEFKKLIEFHQVDLVKVTGTEALRIADNGPQFVKEVKLTTNLEIEIIGGLTEASFIYKGVKAFLGKSEGDHLIMDIGGGSVEFIHFNNEEMIWAESFPIGISVLFNNFQKNDPLSSKEINDTQSFLFEKLENLINHIQTYEFEALIGSAGSFEVITSILEGKINGSIDGSFSRDLFQEIYHDILPLNLEDRLEYPGIPKERVKLIPIAMVLIEYVLEIAKIRKVIVSPFALKEGVISELISQDV